MKRTTILKTSLMILATAGFFMTACKKDNNSNNSSAKDDSTAASLSASAVTAGSVYDDVLNVAFDASSDNGLESVSGRKLSVNSIGGNHPLSGNASGSCAIYTVSPGGSTYPKTVTVDFGSGCTYNNITRSGMITYIFSGKLLTPGTTVSASFTNYVVNGFGLEGNYSLTNNSTLAGIALATSVTNGKITFPDASWYTYAGTRNITQTAGQSTPTDLSDDTYNITGSHTYGSSDGKTLTDNVTTPLVLTSSCQWIEAGVISFKYNGISGTFDYGNNTCDDQAVISVGIIKDTVTLN